MNDERATIHLPDVNQQDQTPEQIEDDKPTTADLAGRGSASDSPPKAAVAPENEKTAPLFPGDEAGKLNERWTAIQAGFVDEPRKAVEDADSLVATAMTRLAEMFADERAKLEGQWDRGTEVSTEDLRVALRRYRAFFGRLLAI